MKISIFKKALVSLMLILLTGLNTGAQTFIKQLTGAGTTEPRIFKSTTTPDYYITATTSTAVYITRVSPAGTLIATKQLKFAGDVAVIKDMIVDWIDNTLVGIATGNSKNYMFKYNFGTGAFTWVKSYPTSDIFSNIHMVSPANYVVTGEMLLSQTVIFQVDRPTGNLLGYQQAGFVGDFYSAFDGTDIYGTCRYYTSGSIFNPSAFRYDVNTGTNLWTNTYVVNTSTVRIYPVAPIVDATDVVVLNSGDATSAFNIYQTGPTDAWLFKTDLAGTLAWTKKITIPGYPRLNAKKILNTATGYYLFLDSYNGTTFYEDYFFIIKTDKSGNLQWANRYGISNYNTVVSAAEDNGDLYVTATSSSYAPGNNTLFLKLDQFGMSNSACGFILPVNVNINTVGNTTQNKPTNTNNNPLTNSSFNITQAPVTTSEVVYCAGTGGGGGGNTLLPCTTLSGSLSSGVIAFYPFGNGSLLDLSGNGFNLSNPTAATPTTDRGGSQCAYRFMGTDYLTITPAAGSWFLNNMTTSAFSISLWYQPILSRPVGDYELLVGRGTPSSVVHCPDTWGEWSVGLYDCRKAVVGFDEYSHWESPTTSLSCANLLTAISNTWHHLAFIYDGVSTYSLYIDGVLYSNSHGPCPPMSANLGSLMMGYGLIGDLDDIVIYNRAITAAEVTALMGLPASCCDGVSSSSKSTTGISNTANSDNGITIYPNPTGGNVSISAAKATIQSVAVYNSTGILQGTYKFNTANVSLNIGALPAGVYFLKVVTDVSTTTEKIIKN